MDMEIAIVVVAYNRVGSMSRLLSSLEKASYPAGKNIPLIISVDKSNTDVVERYADDFQWQFGEKIVDKHDVNLGLRPHMLSLGKWFDKYDAIIVLEDDVVVSPCFFPYSMQTVKRYSDNDSIAGISLYSFKVNYQTGTPFEPLKNEHDVFFMNCAMSWGEVWMRNSWLKFYDWYLKNQDFKKSDHLPPAICAWNDKSWLKYHTKYCIEENKYFVFPYVSLTTNYGDAGIHNNGSGNTIYQVVWQNGDKKTFSLPELDSDAIRYDGFFENLALYNIIEYPVQDVCIDLQNGKKNSMKCRYWLTTQLENYKIVKSYGLNYRPIEANILLNNEGSTIFLYDTSIEEKNQVRCTRQSKLYPYHLSNIFLFIREYGYCNTIKDFLSLLKNKLGV